MGQGHRTVSSFLVQTAIIKLPVMSWAKRNQIINMIDVLDKSIVWKIRNISNMTHVNMLDVSTVKAFFWLV